MRRRHNTPLLRSQGFEDEDEVRSARSVLNQRLGFRIEQAGFGHIDRQLDPFADCGGCIRFEACDHFFTGDPHHDHGLGTGWFDDFDLSLDGPKTNQ